LAFEAFIAIAEQNMMFGLKQLGGRGAGTYVRTSPKVQWK
jgi:hypothetical protein